MGDRSLAIIGAGIGGLAAAIALRTVGINVRIFEQASEFGRIGAAINMTPNAVKVLDRLGVGQAVRDRSHTAAHRISRIWDTGEETSRVELGASALERYGAPPLMAHRADLLSALEDCIPIDCVSFGKRLSGIDQDDRSVELSFDDGDQILVDAVIGADGIHSVIREQLFGPEAPSFTGMSAYRTILPVDKVDGYDTTNFVKWWGPVPQSQIVTCAINHEKELFVFATVPEEQDVRESWSMEGDGALLREHFSGYHDDARQVIGACDDLFRTALYEREPLESWSKGRATLIGDACHAMTPFMAQGAAMALEDAAILSRCAAEDEDWPTVFKRYERNRIERATRIQLGSHQNDWLRNAGNPDWVYGYDVWNAPLCS